MRPNWKKASQALALLLTCALMQVYVLAAPANPSLPTPGESVSKAATGAPLFGRLSTFGEGKVAVNGNEVASGTTILSGATLETPAATGATISLGSVGKLSIAPKTLLTLVFDQSSITVKVVAGDALLTTGEGVKGSLTMPGGETKVTDGMSASSIGSAIFAADDADPQNQKKKCRIFDIPCAVFWGLVGTGTGLGIYLLFHHRSANPSSIGA